MVMRAVRAIGSKCESFLKNSAVLVSYNQLHSGEMDLWGKLFLGEMDFGERVLYPL